MRGAAKPPKRNSDATTVRLARGKRDEVRLKGGQPVDHSGPQLRDEPTLPPTADRNSAACLAISQRKSGQEHEDGVLVASEGEAEARTLTADELRQFVEFFALLDRWDREDRNARTTV